MVDIQFFTREKELRIDLGCGNSKKSGFTGIDILEYPGVDFVTDLEKDLAFIPDNSVKEFFSSHFLEHIRNFEGMMKEIHRTLSPDGICEIVVPHFSNPYFYSDFTHKRFFGLYSFDYFSSENTGKRKVPFYNFPFEFIILRKKLIFRSALNPVLNLIKKHIVQGIFNAFPFMQEIYEGMFTGQVYCSEIRFTLKPVKK
jgi:ubiquinone/menaquinone biosynthesis C-methylase UbiE